MLIELAILVAVTSGLMVALNPRSALVRRARTSVVGGTASRNALGPTALRRAGLTPVLGGPARMLRLAPAVAFGGPRATGADELAALAVPASIAARPAPVAPRVAAARSRRITEPAAARASSRTTGRRTARQETYATS